MKKICLLILMATCAYSAAAQFSFTPKLGLNLSKINFEDDLEEQFDEHKQSFRLGFHAGVGADYSISDNFSVYAEFLYTQKGTEIEGTRSVENPFGGTLTGNGTLQATLDFIEIPLLARYKVGRDTKFYVNAGPTTGYWLGGRAEYEVSAFGITIERQEGKIEFKDKKDITGQESNFTVANEDVHRLEVGAAFGFGMLFNINDRALNVDFRYSTTITSIIEDSNDPNRTWKNNVLSASVGYFFN